MKLAHLLICSIAAACLATATSRAQTESVVVSGTLPLTFKPDTNYEIKNLFLLQSIKDGWLTDLMPERVAKDAISAGPQAAMIVGMEIQSKLYLVGQQRVVLVPANQDVFAQLNLPEKSIIVSATGRFVKILTFATVSGASARAPVFTVDKIHLSSGEDIDLSLKK